MNFVGIVLQKNSIESVRVFCSQKGKKDKDKFRIKAVVGEHYRVRMKEAKTRGGERESNWSPKRVKLSFHPAYELKV